MLESLTEATYYASGCSSIIDFISSYVCQGAQYAYLGDEVDWPSPDLQEGQIPTLEFSLKKLRAREKQGSLSRFLLSLPTLIPSCTHLGVWGVELASLDELAALCQGIASPLCTLRSLDLDLSLKVASTESTDAKKRLVGDALARNTSLTMLTINSALCAPEQWIPCSVWDLHVKLEGDDTLDVVLGVLSDLAHNLVSLTALSITGPFDPSIENHLSGFSRLPMLESEKQLSMTLSTNTSLTSLHLYGFIMPNDAFSLLFTALNRNPNMTSLSLCGYGYLPGEVVRMLFKALEENRYLTSLVLPYNSGEDWPTASSLLDSLQVNGTLMNLEVYETPYEWELEDVTWKEIFAQLERNRKNVEQTNARTSLRPEVAAAELSCMHI